MDTRVSEHVEGKVCMLRESAPEVHWEGFFHAGESCNEMVLPCADGFLSIVSSVVVRWDKLEV